MRRLLASEFVTLDGVMQAPGHEEHPDGKNTWALAYAAEDHVNPHLFGIPERCAWTLMSSCCRLSRRLR